MANTIRFRRGSGTPPSEGFSVGEPAWDDTNKKLYIKSSDGSMSEVSGYNFSTISVSGQSNVVADGTSDTLTLVAGTGIVITTNSSTDAITFNSTSTVGVDPVIAGMIF